MTSRREYERRIYSQLMSHMSASTTDQLLGLVDPWSSDRWSDAEWHRYGSAYQEVIGRLARLEAARQ